MGDLSLATSYFVNGALVSVGTVFILTLFHNQISFDYHPLTALAIILFVWGLVTSITFWQSVGIWRSASRHPSRGGKKFWAIIAKIMVGLGLIQLSMSFSNSALPQFVEMYKILSGDPDIGEYRIRLLNDGREIEIVGGLRYGAARDLAAALDRAPGVHTVHLHSHGGRIGEAEKILEIIKSNRLNTYVSRECLSACTVAFVGGIRRYVGPNGRFGFHSVMFPGAGPKEFASENDRIGKLVLAEGVSKEFVEQAYLEPREDLWFPDTGLLLESEYATGVSHGEFALSGFGFAPAEAEIEHVLLNSEPYVSLYAVDPESFSRILHIFYDGIIKGREEYKVNSEMRGVISEKIVGYLPRSSDDILLQFVELTIDQLSLLKADPAACYSYLFPDRSSSVNLSQYFNSVVVRRELDLMIAVLRSARDVRAPVRVGGSDSAASAYGILLQRLTSKYGSDILQVLAATAAPADAAGKARACHATMALYSEVLLMPRDMSVTVLRAMFEDAQAN